MRFVVTKFGHLAQALRSKHRQVDCRGQCQQTLVGADVGCGTFAFDVLFAGGQSQDIGALAAVIDRLADQAAGHLVDILLAGGEKAQVGPPYESGMPSGWPSPTTISAPISPGVLSKPSAVGLATMQTSAPLA